MKVVILAGGLGTRLSEETQVRPKPMVEIGEHPILWHIMKIYGEQGFTDFVVCLGYKGYVVKEYFANYFLHNSDVTFDLQGQCMEVHQNTVEPWRVTLVDTGAETQTGGRLKRVAPYVADETFMMTYGDGVADVDLDALLRFHEEQGRLATVTAVQPPGRFGALRLDEDGTCVRDFVEKPEGDGGWMNGGFFVLEPEVLEYIAGDDTLWEQRAARAPRARRPAGRLPARRLLAADGHAARQADARGAVGDRRGALEDAGDVRRRLRRPARLRHRPHRVQGIVAHALAARSGRGGHGLRAGAADRAEPVRGVGLEAWRPTVRSPTCAATCATWTRAAGVR